MLTRLFHRDLVDEVIAATGRREVRSRLLPARVVVSYVLALCLFADDGYEEVMRKLVNGLRFLGTWRDGWRPPTTGAISQARQRLGEAPLKALFAQVAMPLAVPGTRGSWFHGWRVMAVDGVVLDVPDTAANVAEFGKRTAGAGGITAAFPQVRVLALGECGTHAIVSAAIGAWRVPERDLFAPLLPDLEPEMLVLADRGFYSYEMWTRAAATGADLVWRIKSPIELPVLQVLPDGSFRSELLPKQMKTDFKRGKRRHIPDTARIPVRVIEYTLTNRGESAETFRLITTILDHEVAPAVELAALYHHRWEFELTLDEIETHQMPRNAMQPGTPLEVTGPGASGDLGAPAGPLRGT